LQHGNIAGPSSGLPIDVIARAGASMPIYLHERTQAQPTCRTGTHSVASPGIEVSPSPSVWEVPEVP
jgi:hypothetical protein